MLESAKGESEDYSRSVDDTVNNTDSQPLEIKDKMNYFRVIEDFKDDINNIEIPQFFIQSEPSLFVEDQFTELTKESLADGFSLKDKDTAIDFETLDYNLVKVDIERSGESVPKYSKLSRADENYFKNYFSKLSSEDKVDKSKEIVYNQVKKMDSVDDRELRDYVDRIVENMTSDEIDNLEKNIYSYADKIKKKINGLLEEYLEQKFNQLIEQGDILCKPNYKLKEYISPLKSISTLPKSLYEEEGDMNNFEHRVINEIISLDNIKWWHRNIDRKGFKINGFINHYPDFIVMTNSGKLILMETKGDHLENAESKQKVRLGRTWQYQSGNQYRYYMVFESKNLNIEGAYQFDKFMEIIKSI
ncbi:hypothetical protein [Paracerasibacillus soli]|uniref:Uncharacterized protein n=2 Tax=Paracerasibacillus soli TaxID=480284 RepID=A0ABU5CV69_9BACI|nr:hypothetical protein [Virgibacillus soli]MDY0410135.1 hypothetical protein [Virgibacillus soli]